MLILKNIGRRQKSKHNFPGGNKLTLKAPPITGSRRQFQILLFFFFKKKRRFKFAWIDISYARFFFYESAEKVLSYARLNCAAFNYFYMSLGQVRHTVSRDRSCCLSTFFYCVHC